MALETVWSSIPTVPETHRIVKRNFFTAGNVPNRHEKDLAMEASVWIAAIIHVVDSADELNAPGGKHQIRRDLYARILQRVRQFRFFLQSRNVTADDQ